MKTRDELPVPARWGADRVTFHFAPEPKAMFLWSTVWASLGALGLTGVMAGLWAGVVLVTEMFGAGLETVAPGVLVLGAVAFPVSLAVIAAAMVGVVRATRPTRLVLSGSELVLDRVRVDRLDVVRVGVHAGRVQVETRSGGIVQSRALLGVDQDSVHQALDRYCLTEREQDDEIAAASRAVRELGPLRERGG